MKARPRAWLAVSVLSLAVVADVPAPARAGPSRSAFVSPDEPPLLATGEDSPEGDPDPEEASASPAGCGRLYGVDAERALVRIDPATGEGVVVGSLGIDVGPVGIAFDPRGRLWALSPGDRPREMVLHRVDLRTGRAAVRARFDLSRDTRPLGTGVGLQWGPGGKRLYWATDSYVSILDPERGEVRPFPGESPLAFRVGSLALPGRCRDFVSYDPDGNRLMRVGATDGAVEAIGPTGLAAAGEVVAAGWAAGAGGGFGQVVVLKHTHAATARVFYALYAHLESVAVTAGTPGDPRPVAKGEPLGTLGASGCDVDGCRLDYWSAPHLHFALYEHTADNPVVLQGNVSYGGRAVVPEPVDGYTCLASLQGTELIAGNQPQPACGWRPFSFYNVGQYIGHQTLGELGFVMDGDLTTSFDALVPSPVGSVYGPELRITFRPLQGAPAQKISQVRITLHVGARR